MDWKLVATTFVAVFLAELGDKTQLMTLSLAGSNAGKRAVFLGASLALVATTSLAVLGGEFAARLLPVEPLRRAAGVLFIVLGCYFLWDTRGS